LANDVDQLLLVRTIRLELIFFPWTRRFLWSRLWGDASSGDVGECCPW